MKTEAICPAWTQTSAFVVRNHFCSATEVWKKTSTGLWSVCSRSLWTDVSSCSARMCPWWVVPSRAHLAEASRAGGMSGSDLAVCCPQRGCLGTSPSAHICTSAPVNSQLIPQHRGRGKLNHCREMWVYAEITDLTLKRLRQKHIFPSADFAGKGMKQKVLLFKLMNWGFWSSSVGV